VKRWRFGRRPVETPAAREGWFDLTMAGEADLSAAQRMLLEAARRRLDALAPSGLKPSDSWATFEAGYGLAETSEGSGALWLCVPIIGKPHASLQLGEVQGAIVGGVQDRHYAWDDSRGESFRLPIPTEGPHRPIEQALAWLEERMRQHRMIS
jgi:hypothetical protein